jgi:hypothetical protein
VIQRYLATGPEDGDATVNDVHSVGPMKYTLARDLAIFELRHPLPNRRGVAFSLDELQTGQKVDIYAYPLEGINPVRSLRQFHGTFKGETTTGLLAFDYNLSGNGAIRPGASGGIVVDTKTQQIVGILQGVAKDGEAVALAVPVQSLVDFVGKVQPFLAQKIFPSTLAISPVSADLYPKFVPAWTDGLHFRPEESPEAKRLRRIKVFQYQAAIEDGVCTFKSVYDFGFFAFNQIYTVACYGKVWTDEDTNILRISEHLEIPGKWHDYQAVVTYGWLNGIDQTPRLIPLTISAQVGDNKKVSWCRGVFTNYKVFTSQVKMAAN